METEVGIRNVQTVVIWGTAFGIGKVTGRRSSEGKGAAL
jgi:hypothetical protein